MTYREELDVAIDGNYDRLQPDSELLQEKEIAELLFNLCKCMNSIDPTFRVEMCYRMPTPLYTVLSQYGLEAVLDP